MSHAKFLWYVNQYIKITFGYIMIYTLGYTMLFGANALKEKFGLMPKFILKPDGNYYPHYPEFPSYHIPKDLQNPNYFKLDPNSLNPGPSTFNPNSYIKPNPDWFAGPGDI